MANEKILNTRIQLKIATYAEWTDASQALKGANFILKRGEIGLCQIGDTDATGKAEATTNPTVLFKVGDGSTPFKTLKWASALAADVYGWAKASDVKFENKKLIFVGGGPVDANGQKTDKEIAINFITEDEAKGLFYTKSEVDALIDGVQEAVDAIVIPTPIDFGVLTVDKKDGTAIEVDNTDDQNPKVGFKIDAASSGAKGGTVVKLSQSNDGLKAEVDLSEYRKTADDQNTAHTHSTKAKSGIKANGAGDITGDTTFELNVGLDFNATTKLITLYDKDDNTKTALASLDAAAFIKDGMISSVELVNKDGSNNEGQFLKITWNTDAGKDVVYLNVTELVDVYTGEAGITVTDDKVIKHTNAITAKTSYVTTTKALAHGGTFDVVEEKYDAQGHITGAQTTTYTLPAAYIHPAAEVTSTSTNITLDHGDTFVVKNETFDTQGHVKTETATTYTLPELDLSAYTTTAKTPELIQTIVTGSVDGEATLESSNIDGFVNYKVTVNNNDIVDVTLQSSNATKIDIREHDGHAIHAVIAVKDKGIATQHIADQAVGAEQTKAYQKADGTSEEVWVFDCGGAE